jgi:hypothetical protein
MLTVRSIQRDHLHQHVIDLASHVFDNDRYLARLVAVSIKSVARDLLYAHLLHCSCPRHPEEARVPALGSGLVVEDHASLLYQP